MTDRPFKLIQGTGELQPADDETLIPRDYALIDEALRKERRANAALKGRVARLERLLAGDLPGVDLATSDLLKYWRDTIRGPKSRAVIDVNSDRHNLVRRYLQGLANVKEIEDPEDGESMPDAAERVMQAAQRIRDAIDGAARCPFVHYGERVAEDGPGHKRRDDILDILKDERRMEQCEAIVAEQPKRQAYRRRLAAMLKADPQLRAQVARLAPGGEVHPEILARAVRWCAAQRSSESV